MVDGFQKIRHVLKIMLGMALLLPVLSFAKSNPMGDASQISESHPQYPWALPVSGEMVNEHHRYAEDDHRYRNLDDLPPKQREKLLKRRERFESLPPEKKQKIRQARDRYRELPANKRKALKEEWENMSPEEKKRYLRRMERQRN